MSYDETIAKSIALAEHNGDDYFLYSGIAYHGTIKGYRKEYAAHIDYAGGVPCTFAEYLAEEAIQLDEYDEYGDYLVLDDSEADEKCAEYIKDSLWAFNADFLAGETGIDSEVFEAIHANDRCEDNNAAMLSIIEGTCGIDSFIESAIGADGRGHFLVGYDFNEHEINVDVPHEFENKLVKARFYIYRVN
jgi:hypothetical protein